MLGFLFWYEVEWKHAVGGWYTYPKMLAAPEHLQSQSLEAHLSRPFCIIETQLWTRLLHVRVACILETWIIGDLRHRSALLVAAWGCNRYVLSGDEGS
jgi:hypothetical protein